MDRLLSSTLLDDETFHDSLTLDQFRKNCLLAFYDFHQNPGNQSWTRISRLTRLAYRQGLDRLEKLRSLYSEWAVITVDDIDEWRAIWWCIYKMDSYSNLGSGTPYLIDETLVNTSLMATIEGISLPSRPAELWQILPSILSNKESSLRNIHMVTITVLRQAGRTNRAYPLRSADDNQTHVTNTERSLSKTCLALPSGWLNPRRNVFSNESSVDHHARLVTVLHLRLARLLLSLTHCGERDGTIWVQHWETILEVCQDIVAVAEHWDSTSTIEIDPAVSFIFFTALTFLTLHKKSTPSTRTELIPSLDHGITILCLQLEQFGRTWTMARLLLRE